MGKKVIKGTLEVDGVLKLGDNVDILSLLSIEEVGDTTFTGPPLTGITHKTPYNYDKVIEILKDYNLCGFIRPTGSIIEYLVSVGYISKMTTATTQRPITTSPYLEVLALDHSWKIEFYPNPGSNPSGWYAVRITVE